MEDKRDFNINHPEKKEGEVFLVNVLDDEQFLELEWKTKRRGNVAYDVYGKVIKLLGHRVYPVFIQLAEVEKNIIGLSNF